jgi:hypothetical protein
MRLAHAVLVTAAALLALASAWSASSADADTLTFGSSLSVPATLNTAEDLAYEGINIPFHVAHDGVDTLIWNAAQASGAPQAPQGGEVKLIRLEGCAEQPRGATAPLTEIRFQTLTPQPGGGYLVDLTTGAFQIPVCGAGGASGSTVTSYQPTNLCIAAGDYVGFHDEGGCVPAAGVPPYAAGVPYEVIGSVGGTTLDSFVGASTTNGNLLAPSVRTASNGFASNKGEELLLQAVLGTGPDAHTACPGGTEGTSGTSGAPTPSPGGSHAKLPPLHVGAQTDGINAHGVASIAVFCRQAAGCKGTLSLSLPGSGSHSKRPTASFNLKGGKTGHVPVKVGSAIVKAARRHRASGIRLNVVATLTGGKSFSQTIAVKL